jgi:hypothetical protein
MTALTVEKSISHHNQNTIHENTHRNPNRIDLACVGNVLQTTKRHPATPSGIVACSNNSAKDVEADAINESSYQVKDKS